MREKRAIEPNPSPPAERPRRGRRAARRHGEARKSARTDPIRPRASGGRQRAGSTARGRAGARRRANEPNPPSARRGGGCEVGPMGKSRANEPNRGPRPIASRDSHSSACVTRRAVVVQAPARTNPNEVGVASGGAQRLHGRPGRAVPARTDPIARERPGAWGRSQVGRLRRERTHSRGPRSAATSRILWRTDWPRIGSRVPGFRARIRRSWRFLDARNARSGYDRRSNY